MKKGLSLLRSKKGQGTVEYALVTVAIVGIIAAVMFNNGEPDKSPLGEAIKGAFDEVKVQVEKTL